MTRAQRGGHQRLAQPDDVADDHAPLAVELAGGDLHRPLLKLEQHTLELRRNPHIADTGLRLARQLVSELEIDLIRRRPRLTPPSLSSISSASSRLMSRQKRSPQCRSNHARSASHVRRSISSTLSSPCPESPAKVRLLLPTIAVVGVCGSLRWKR